MSDKKSDKTTRLLKYLKESGDFPDHELAENVRKAYEENRKTKKWV